jgi:hypothetical protein
MNDAQLVSKTEFAHTVTMLRCMIPRDLASPLLAALERSPIVTITGPRQSGKTTLARALIAKPSANLEATDVRRVGTTTRADSWPSSLREQSSTRFSASRLPDRSSTLPAAEAWSNRDNARPTGHDDVSIILPSAWNDHRSSQQAAGLSHHG